MAKGPYFVWRNFDECVLCTDGKMRKSKDALYRGLICIFNSVSTARRMADKIGPQNIAVVTQKTMRGYLGFPVKEWEDALKSFHVGVDPDWKPDLIWSPSRGAFVKPNQAAQVAAANQSAEPAAPSANEPAQEEASSVDASPAAMEQIWNVPLIQDTIDLLEKAEALASRWGELAPELNGDLSRLESAICDELHFVEFMSLDTKRGYNSYKRLHKLRIERRQVKNEIAILNSFCTVFKTTPKNMAAYIQALLRNIDGLRNRMYTPRVKWPQEDDTVNF